eukprot:TRINITY_DN3559_c0_g1_i1.p1 TRINITY_DN3559_c0_g1~~TRINITY_DN3559_c0_g1_i1.p1  ORF type:complete len:265 (+),score=54.54 TRINITY_DN3559_c0_g1_i1:450-1244(+)
MLPSTRGDDFEKHTPSGKNKKKAVLTMAAMFSKDGDTIFTGNTKGIISIVKTDTLETLSTFKVCSFPIKSLRLSRNGKLLSVITNEKLLRVFDVENPLIVREFQDIVNKVHWKQACFSSNSEYVVGGAGQDHQIFIWDISDGHLVKMLEGHPKEPLQDLVWHPLRPMIVSCSIEGLVYIWSTNWTENWSAFAPDFKELEENEEYIEREDEFDLIQEEENNKKIQLQEDAVVDITSFEKLRGSLSSESEDELVFLPTVPDPEFTT